MSKNTIENLENELNTLKIEHSEMVRLIKNTLNEIKSETGLHIVKSKNGLPFAVFSTEKADMSQSKIFTKLQQQYKNMHYPASKEALFKDLKSLSNAFAAIGEMIDEDNLPNIYEFGVKKLILYG